MPKRKSSGDERDGVIVWKREKDPLTLDPDPVSDPDPVPVPDLKEGETLEELTTINDQTIADTKKAGEPQKTTNNTDGLILAGPTNPLSVKRVQVLTPKKFRDEPLILKCEWQECCFTTRVMDVFMDHVGSHTPMVEVVLKDNMSVMKMIMRCNWNNCPWQTNETEDLKRHLYLHAYHTRLKCLGQNMLNCTKMDPCGANSDNRNILPDLCADLVCAWGPCRDRFVNIQLYYNHIRDHVDDTPRGKNVPGGIQCVWRGCRAFFPNAVKLKDHMRSHTQEKLVACPTCGGLFSNRTRFFDHCQRQVPQEEETFACDACMKSFSTARLLRDHIRSHINTYKCHLCEMTCSAPSALNTHMRYKHSEDKPYACDYCEYRCKSYNDLVRHAKIHSGIVYKCDDCDYECRALTTLKSHWAKQHAQVGSKYACHLCDKLFFKGYYLTKHLTKIHNLSATPDLSRFRYKLHEDGFFRLQTVRYESVDSIENPVGTGS